MDNQVQYFAIWLTPADSDYNVLSSIINDLRTRFDTDRFAPHSTLCSGEWRGDLDHLRAKVKLIADQFSTRRVAKTKIYYENTKFQYFYVGLNESDLDAVFQCVRNKLPASRPPKSRPHLSLLYSTQFNSVSREELSKEFNPRVPTHIHFDRLTLVFPENNDWDNISKWVEHDPPLRFNA